MIILTLDFNYSHLTRNPLKKAQPAHRTLHKRNLRFCREYKFAVICPELCYSMWLLWWVWWQLQSFKTPWIKKTTRMCLQNRSVFKRITFRRSKVAIFHAKIRLMFKIDVMLTTHLDTRKPRAQHPEMADGTSSRLVCSLAKMGWGQEVWYTQKRPQRMMRWLHMCGEQIRGIRFKIREMLSMNSTLFQGKSHLRDYRGGSVAHSSVFELYWRAAVFLFLSNRPSKFGLPRCSPL